MRRLHGLGGVGVVALVIAGVSAFTATMLMVAYPGAFEWTAPLLCPDDQPDTFVVQYSVQTSDGTGTNFTMFCMGSTGQFTEVGTWPPLAVLTAAVAGGLVVVIAVLAVLAWLGRRAARSPRPSDECPAGPVDAPRDAPPGAAPDAPVTGPPVDAPAPPAVPPPPPV